MQGYCEQSLVLGAEHLSQWRKKSSPGQMPLECLWAQALGWPHRRQLWRWACYVFAGFAGQMDHSPEQQVGLPAGIALLSVGSQ